MYFVGAILSGIVFLILDIADNCLLGHINVLYSLSRLPIASFGWPLWLCFLIYPAIADRK